MCWFYKETTYAKNCKGGDTIIKCDICGIEHTEDKIKHIPIKGKIRNICEGCAAAIKGFA